MSLQSTECPGCGRFPYRPPSQAGVKCWECSALSVPSSSLSKDKVPEEPFFVSPPKHTVVPSNSLSTDNPTEEPFFAAPPHLVLLHALDPEAVRPLLAYYYFRLGHSFVDIQDIMLQKHNVQISKSVWHRFRHTHLEGARRVGVPEDLPPVIEAVRDLLPRVRAACVCSCPGWT